MQLKKAISDWANKWFFVAEKTPRVTIALVSPWICPVEQMAAFGFAKQPKF
jgi:hypothetical protein